MNDTTSPVAAPIPIVGYLSLADTPQLIATVCTHCRAYYFDRRDACASCFGATFTTTPVSTTGTLETFTIVEVAAPVVTVPYVAGVVNCDGISVRANIVNVKPSVDSVRLGMPVALTTFGIGTDEPTGRLDAVTGLEGRIGTELMPGVFAQIGMQYLHRHNYSGTPLELFARISEQNHSHSTLNPLAAHTKAMSAEHIRNDIMIA